MGPETQLRREGRKYIHNKSRDSPKHFLAESYTMVRETKDIQDHRLGRKCKETDRTFVPNYSRTPSGIVSAFINISPASLTATVVRNGCACLLPVVVST